MNNDDERDYAEDQWQREDYRAQQEREVAVADREDATTVQPATDDEIIEMECRLVAFYLKQDRQREAVQARERLEQWVLQKHGKRS